MGFTELTHGEFEAKKQEGKIFAKGNHCIVRRERGSLATNLGIKN